MQARGGRSKIPPEKTGGKTCSDTFKNDPHPACNMFPL
jgi:hypothetical protein